MDREVLTDIGIMLIPTIMLIIPILSMSSSLEDAVQENHEHENFKNCIIHNQKNISSCGHLVDFNKLKGE